MLAKGYIKVAVNSFFKYTTKVHHLFQFHLGKKLFLTFWANNLYHFLLESRDALPHSFSHNIFWLHNICILCSFESPASVASYFLPLKYNAQLRMFKLCLYTYIFMEQYGESPNVFYGTTSTEGNHSIYQSKCGMVPPNSLLDGYMTLTQSNCTRTNGLKMDFIILLEVPIESKKFETCQNGNK